MNEIENLFYALGHLAYAVAMADGSVQKEERLMVHQIVTEEIQKKNPEMNISEIIFSILHEQAEDLEVTFKRATKELKISKEHLDQEMKDDFVRILYKVAEAFPPVEAEEEQIIQRSKKLLESL